MYFGRKYAEIKLNCSHELAIFLKYHMRESMKRRLKKKMICFIQKYFHFIKYGQMNSFFNLNKIQFLV